MKYWNYLLCCVVLICSGIGLSAQEKRVIRISSDMEKITLPLEIVCPENTPLLRYASEELQKILTKATGKKPAICTRPSTGKFHLILGDNALARKAGLDVKKLPMDGFYILRKGNQVFLAGKDAAKSDPRVKKYMENYDRGTLSAVYDFLERFASVRFYFPHACGIVIPRKPLALPKTIAVTECPDLINRSWVIRGTGLYPEEKKNSFPDGPAKSMLQLRYRAYPYGQSNSLNRFRFLERFGKSHPEYFALMTDGKRYNDPKMKMSGQLCFESGIREEIFQDIKAFLSGKKASSRGMRSWDVNAFSAGYVTICPQDWFYWCGCEKCRKIASPGRDRLYRDLKEQKKVSNYIWQFTADLARRMKKEGVKGTLVQLAYFPYNQLPECRIPDNVHVAVATFPGIAAPDHPRMKITEEQVAPWLKAAPGGVFFRAWTGKTMARTIPYAPAMKHNYIADYFSKRPFRYKGAYIDECSDYFLFAYLNLYVFSKVTWNQKADVKQILSEHFALMFGKGAPFLRKFYDDLEKVWNDQIIGKCRDSGLGLTIAVPGEIQLWTKIYSPSRLASYNRLFDQAEKVTSGEELQRVRFIRKHLLGKLLEGAQKFSANRNSLDHWKIHPGQKVFLRPHKGTFNEVQTVVDFRETPDHFLFTFDCKEPFMKEIKADSVKRDCPDLWQDSDVELFLLPHKDSPVYYQFIANANGAVSDYEHGVKGKGKGRGIAWNSGVAAQAQKGSDSWKVTLSIPKKSLGKLDPHSFRINLGRRRVLKGSRRVAEEFYKWAPYAGGTFHHIHNWGRLVRSAYKETNLLKNPSFSGKVRDSYNVLPAWSLWKGSGNHKGQKAEPDTKYFITGGQSLHLVNTKGNVFGLTQRAKDLKPKTRYRLSFYLRTKDVEHKRQSLFSGVYVTKGKNVHYPSGYISGTNEWTRMAYEFTTPEESKLNRKAPFGISLRVPGEIWVDEFRLEEVAP